MTSEDDPFKTPGPYRLPTLPCLITSQTPTLRKPSNASPSVTSDETPSPASTSARLLLMSSFFGPPTSWYSEVGSSGLAFVRRWLLTCPRIDDQPAVRTKSDSGLRRSPEETPIPRSKSGQALGRRGKDAGPAQPALSKRALDGQHKGVPERPARGQGQFRESAGSSSNTIHTENNGTTRKVSAAAASVDAQVVPHEQQTEPMASLIWGKDDPPSGTSRPTPHTVLAHAAATQRTNRQSPNSALRTASMPGIPSRHHAPNKSIFVKDPSEWDDLPQDSTPALSTASPAVRLNPFDFWITGDSGTPTPSARSEFGAPTSADAVPLLADEARRVQQPGAVSREETPMEDSYKLEYARDDEHHASETAQEQDTGAVSREETPIEESYKSDGSSDDEHHASETDEEQRSYKSEYASDDEHHASETGEEQRSYKSEYASDDEHHASETDEEQRSYKSEYTSDDEHHASETAQEQDTAAVSREETPIEESYKSGGSSDNEHHASETDQEQDPGAVSREETPIEDSYKSEGASDDEHHATHASRDPQPEALGPEEALEEVPNKSGVNSDEEPIASEAGRAQQPAVMKPDAGSDNERDDLPEGVYLVERVLQKQRSGKKLWLKIQWKGLKSASWELAEHMRNELGEKDYEELLETAPRKRRKKGPKW
jgi:hypothetical protein